MEKKPKMYLGSFEEYRMSILRHIEWLISGYYKDPKKISINQIKKDEKKINVYENFDQLEPISEKKIIILDDEKIDINNAEKAILEGKVLWEHTAAGEATRLGMGTKYLLDLSKFDLRDVVFRVRQEAIAELRKKGLEGEELKKERKRINKEITKKSVLAVAGSDPRKIVGISLGNRHMLQMAFDIYRIAQKNKQDPKKILKRQTVLVILNEQTAEEILEEFKNYKFFGLDPGKVHFMVQRSFHGIYIKDGCLFYDNTTEKNKRLHNHGQMIMQKTQDETIFRVDAKNSVKKYFLTSVEFEKILSRHDDLLSYNVEDLGYLTNSLDLPSLSLALDLGKKGYGMVMEIVAQNPIKPQKGGACFFDKKLNRVVIVESNRLKDIKNEEIKHLNKNFNHYPNPVQSFQIIKKQGIPITFEVKEGYDQNGKPQDYIYACPVQGDTNFLVKTAFVMRKNIKPIYNWKSPATTPLAIKAMFEQDNQAGFGEFVKKIKKGELI